MAPNDYEGHQQTVNAGFGQHITVDWPTNAYGYHGVIITANTPDAFTYRYAGRIS